MKISYILRHQCVHSFIAAETIRDLNDCLQVLFSDVLLWSPSQFHPLSGRVDHGLEQGRGQRGTRARQSVQGLGIGLCCDTYSSW